MPDLDRARSFMERYIIARAPLFRVGFEEEDAWKAILAAKSIYRSIAQQSKTAEPREDVGVQASVGQAPSLTVSRALIGSLGATPPPPPPQPGSKRFGQFLKQALNSLHGTSVPDSLMQAAEDHMKQGGTIP